MNSRNRVYKKTKKRLRKLPFIITFLFILAISFLIFFSFNNTSVASDNYDKRQLIEVTVTKGDTLWGLVREYRPNYQDDIRILISEIKNINNLKTACLDIGQTLYIPID